MRVETRRPRQFSGDRPSPRSLVSYLSAVDIFQDLTAQEIEAVHSVIQVNRCQRGTVSLYRLTLDGRKLVVRTVGAGTIFGEMSMAGQSMRDCFAEAQDDSLVCTVTRPDMESLLRERPDVALRLLGIMGRRIQELEEHLEQKAYGTVRQRLGRLIQKRAEFAWDICEMRGYTHEDLGDAIGAARQTVTQKLRRLEDEGLVEIGRKRIRLLDIDGLKLIVDGG